MYMSENIVFKDKDGENYIVSFPILNQPVPSRLRLWVAYEIGGFSYSENKRLKRGYYLYVSFEECSNMGRVLVCGGDDYRVLLGEVARKSEKAYRQFSEKAGTCAKEIVEKLYKDALKIDWDNGVPTRWGGYGNGVGFYSDYYSIVE